VAVRPPGRGAFHGHVSDILPTSQLLIALAIAGAAGVIRGITGFGGRW